MDTPLASRWFERQQPVFFDGSQESGFPEPWVRNFREHDLRNAAANGLLDKSSCIATYFSFHQLPVLNEPILRRTFELFTPVLHETFARVIRLHETKSYSDSSSYETLSEREREIAAYVAEGMSNGAIANVLTVSENTIRNHVSRILEKTGCGNRAGLARLVVQQAARSHGMGTKVL
jgi:DNA-binding CsgD family transcriptional regulator